MRKPRSIAVPFVFTIPWLTVGCSSSGPGPASNAVDAAVSDATATSDAKATSDARPTSDATAISDATATSDATGSSDAAGALDATPDAANDAAGAANLSRIKHVFVIVLENENFDVTFGSSAQNPFLKSTVLPAGVLLTNYFGIGHVSLGNYIAMISGQSLTTDTRLDCQVYKDFNLTGVTTDGTNQAIGTGCVYPSSIPSLPDQLNDAGLSWKAYMEDMGNDPSRESATCGHPALNAADLTQSAEAPKPDAGVPEGDQYATRHNPFVYFHSIIDSPDCARNVVNFTNLASDLSSIATTANFVFITPNLCDDGHDGDGTGAPGKGCVNGLPGGLTSADAFLHTWVPKITASPAYLKDGLLIITFDEGGSSQTVTPVDGGVNVNLSFAGTSCCNQQPGPNVTYPFTITQAASATTSFTISMASFGGDRTGTIMLSPFIKAGTQSAVPYNHYSLLKTLEDIYGLSHLGFANQPGLASMGTDVFSNP
jgi:hypothetical protein